MSRQKTSGRAAVGKQAKRRKAEPLHGVHAITSAAVSRSASIGQRKRRYLVAMLIRTGCFIAMVVAPVGLEGKALLAAGAIFLPYAAVVIANAYSRGRQTPLASAEAPALEENRG